jgi:hypothetical protein
MSAILSSLLSTLCLCHPNSSANQELRDFLVGLATDQAKLGEFIKDVDGAMSRAGLAPEDRRKLAYYTRPRLLCIDELGYLSYDSNAV